MKKTPVIAPNKKKVGRPSKFNSIDLEQVSKLYLNGFTDNEVCDFFKISERTLNTWKIMHPEFLQSIKEWKSFADMRVERSLYERACGYSHQSEEIFCAFGKVTRVNTVKHYPPDPLSMIFWLKNRKPDQYRDKPVEPEDEELKEAELTFTGVPKKGAKIPNTMMRYLN